jgi:dihydrofolate reductase
MRRSLVVAMSRNRVIGRDNQLPWKLPADMAFFKRVTMGHPVIMGRRTYESIGKPLPGRQNIVVSGNAAYEAPGCSVVRSMEEAYRVAGDADDVSIIGGSSIFAASLPIADVIYLTEVDAEVEGDVFFPPFDRSDWQETELERHPADARHAYPFRILKLERKKGDSPPFTESGGRVRGAG